MFKYDAATGRLLDIPVIVPHDPFQWPQRPLTLDRKNIWRTAQWSERDKVIYAIDGGASYLSRYDPKPAPFGSIEFLAQMCAPQFRGSHNIPYSTLSMIIGKDNRIYFAPTGTSFDYDVPGSEGANKAGMMTYLVSYDPHTCKRTDYGRLIDKQGGHILGTQSAACGPDGTLYFFGAVKNAKVAGVPDQMSVSLKLMIVNPRDLTAESVQTPDPSNQ